MPTRNKFKDSFNHQMCSSGIVIGAPSFLIWEVLVEQLNWRISIERSEDHIFGWYETSRLGMTNMHLFEVKACEDEKNLFSQTYEKTGGMTFILGRIIMPFAYRQQLRFNRNLKAEVERRNSAD